MANSTLQDLTGLLAALPHGLTLIGGDFNDVLSPDLDHLQTPGRQLRQAGGLRKWAEGFGLFDVWRLWHPSTQLYTHTSAAHGSHSRIDYLFLSAPMLPTFP